MTWLVDNKHWNALLDICKRVCMLIIGLIPFIVNLCRLGAAVYQIFVFRKYNTGCLKYVVNEDFRNQTIISQVKKQLKWPVRYWCNFSRVWDTSIVGTGSSIHFSCWISLDFLFILPYWSELESENWQKLHFTKKWLKLKIQMTLIQNKKMKGNNAC